MLDGVGTRKRRRRSSRRRRSVVRSAIFCALATGALAASLVFLLASRPGTVTPAARSEVDASPDRETPAAEPYQASREVYPYSVIPGGVYDTTELVDAAEHDPVVARHYGDITLAAMRVEVVDTAREAYMSYRIGDSIFWTKRKLPLREGERILTDGDVAVRARCGNRLSNVPMTPTSEVEPPLNAFERDADPLFQTAIDPVGGSDMTIAGLPLGLWPGGSVSPGIAPTSEGGSPGPFVDGGGLYAFPLLAGSGKPDASEPDGDGDQPPIVFVLPPSDDEGHTDAPVIEGPGDVPSVIVDIPGFTHGDHPGNGGGSGGSPGGTLLPPDPLGGSDGELPPDSVVPEPATLTLLGTGLLWGAAKRKRQRTDKANG